MNALTAAIAAVAVGATLATGTLAQTAREVRGASPYETIADEPAPRLVIDPPFPEPLALGIFQAQYRVENLRIVNVFGPDATAVSPRIGHLHITVDDLPWWWADASDNNTVDVAGLPPGPHSVTVRLVNANHEVFPGEVYRFAFVVPEPAPGAPAHGGH